MQACRATCALQEEPYHFDRAEGAAHEPSALLSLHVCPSKRLGHAANSAIAQIISALYRQVCLLGCVQATIDPRECAVACLGQLLGS